MEMGNVETDVGPRNEFTIRSFKTNHRSSKRIVIRELDFHNVLPVGKYPIQSTDDGIKHLRIAFLKCQLVASVLGGPVLVDFLHNALESFGVQHVCYGWVPIL